MPYIYRYTNDNGEIKYVGIIKEDTNFPTRFYQHKRDEWYPLSKQWVVEYSYYGTQCDVEMLEAHLISFYLGKGFELFNKAKRNWGMSAFVHEDEIEWKTFREPIVFRGRSRSLPSGKTCFEEYVELGASYQLLKLAMSNFFNTVGKMPRFRSAKNSNHVTRVYNGVRDLESKLRMETSMLEDIDPGMHDYPHNQLLSIFYGAFEDRGLGKNPVAELVTDKAVEALYETLFKISGYKTKREIRDGEINE